MTQRHTPKAQTTASGQHDSAPPTDPVAVAQAAGLRYVSDEMPGIRRKRAGKSFRYIGLDGKPITNQAELDRIKALGIPPAYQDVWICPDPNGHIQATGRDARGRKQYRYHQRWRETRDEDKYNRMLAFSAALPKIRERVAQDLARPGLPREKVLATVVRLLETTAIRVGNEEYARQNKSFGLTTMRDRHVKIEGSRLHFRFRGKSGKKHTIDLQDKRLARIVKQCQELPGQDLFQYIDEQGQRQDVTSSDVNAYLHEITGQEFTAKDFRTWAGTVLCAVALEEIGAFETSKQAKRNIVEAVKAVAERLGNTPAVCRKSYIHPAVLEGYLDTSLGSALAQRIEDELKDAGHGLRSDEHAVVEFLQQRLSTSYASEANTNIAE